MTIRVLAIDGGGIRGVAPAHMLARLDTKLAARGKKPVTGSFELFAGTSTGCIVAAGLAAAGKAATPLEAADIEELYRRRGREMFTRQFLPLKMLRSGLYSEEVKGRVMREILGDLTLGQLDRNFVGTFYNLGAGPGPVFANGGERYRQRGDNDYSDVPLWKVVNASSSAPFYFDPAPLTALHHRMSGADGGLFANNPALCGYVEAKKVWGHDDILVASFGCGEATLQFPRRKRWGLLDWASPGTGVPLLQAMFDGQSQTVSYQMEWLLPETRFFRFKFSLDRFGKIAMDDASPANIDRIVDAAEDYLAKTGDALLDRLVDQLWPDPPP